MTIKRKNKKSLAVPAISSAEEAVEEINAWHDHSPLNDPYDGVEVSDNQMDKLRALVRKVWEDAYQAGRNDARSDAAVEAAEAEWFGG